MNTIGAPPAPPLPPPPRPDGERPPASRSRGLLAVLAVTAVLVTSVMVSAFVTRDRTSSSICRQTDRLLDAAESEPLGEPTRIDRLEDLVPTEVGRIFEPVGDTRIPGAVTIGESRGPIWRAELDEDGFRRGLIRTWDLPNGIAQVQVYEFATQEGALAFQRFAVGGSCGASRDVFAPKSVARSTGLQIWWADGDESEQVSFVRGTRRYLANVRASTVPDRDLVLRLTAHLSKTAR